jgi:DNA-binding MarR family transcriptional regulator
MVAQPWLQDNDLVLWTLLLAEDLNAAALARLQQRHPDIRYAHGFLFQQLVDGPRPVGEVAENLGVTSQAVSKTAGQLEQLGYVARTRDSQDGRVHRIGLTDRGRAALDAGREIREQLNRELAQALGEERAHTAARALRAALAARGAMAAIEERRVPPAQDLSSEGR